MLATTSALLLSLCSPCLGITIVSKYLLMVHIQLFCILSIQRKGWEEEVIFFHAVFESMKSVSVNSPICFPAHIWNSDVNTKRRETWRRKKILREKVMWRRAVTAASWGKIVSELVELLSGADRERIWGDDTGMTWIGNEWGVKIRIVCVSRWVIRNSSD